MIYVPRGDSEPEVYRSKQLRKLKQSARRHFSASVRTRNHFDWETLNSLLDADAKPYLFDLFLRKCAYCETEVTLEKARISHFRPFEFRCMKTGELVHPYWSRAFEWSNLLLACPTCLGNKADSFPIVEERPLSAAAGPHPANERPQLLDPCTDLPEDHLIFSADGRVSERSHRGATTIVVLQLNREELVAERKARLVTLAEALAGLTVPGKRDVAYEEIHYCASGRGPYAAATRQFLNARLWPLRSSLREEKLQELGDLLRVGDPRDLVPEQQRSWWSGGRLRGVRRIQRIEIHNFRSIKDTTIEMPPSSDREAWLMLVGDNASGKSSVLQAAALGLLDHEDFDNLPVTASSLVRRGEAEGYIEVTLTNESRPIRVSFSCDVPKFQRFNPCQPVTLLCYGAVRLLPPHRNPPEEIPPVAVAQPLFDPSTSLLDAEQRIATQFSNTDFESAAAILRQIMRLPAGAHITREGGQLQVELHAKRFGLSELSGGYQSVIALLCDMMVRLHSAGTPLTEAEGIVLLDEIDAHLYPSWRIEIVPLLRRAFPRLQFICTTHDALCLRGIDSSEVRVLRNDGQGTRLERIHYSIDRLRADQLLTSTVFGLTSTRDPNFQRKMERYLLLRGQQTRSSKEDAELQSLAATLQEGMAMGETADERARDAEMRRKIEQLEALDRKFDDLEEIPEDLRDDAFTGLNRILEPR